MLERILKLHKQAPEFVHEYEQRRLRQAAKLNIYASTTDKEEKEMLSVWLANDEHWLVNNEEDYNLSLRLLNVKTEELETIQKGIERVQQLI